MMYVCVCLCVYIVDMSPTDYRTNNESLLIGGEVCLWTEYADDDSIMPRLWSVYCIYTVAGRKGPTVFAE